MADGLRSDQIIRNLLEPEHGAIVIGEDVFGDEKYTGERPYVIVATDTVPKSKQYSAMVISLKDHDGEAIALSDTDLWDGDGFDRESFACPWALYPLKHRQIRKRIGALEDPAVGRLVRAAREYLVLPGPVTRGSEPSVTKQTAINAEG